MRLIHNKHIERKIIVKYEIWRCFICSNGNAAVFNPKTEGTYPCISINSGDRNGTEFSYFTAPVCKHACGADHDKMRCAGIFKRNHCGDGLYRFSKAHLVAEQNFFLMKNVFYSPFLIAAQGAAQSFRVYRFFPDLFGKFFGKTVNTVIRAEHTGADVFKHIKKGHGLFGKIIPCF